MSNSNTLTSLTQTLKSWPIITIATISLCYLTQTIAKSFGIELPDQANVDLVRQAAGWNRQFAFLCLQILILLPAVEELIFRKGIYSALGRMIGRSDAPMKNHAIMKFTAVFSSILFSAAHYLAQPFPDAAFLALFFFGLAQCWLYRKTGRLWCAILNHGLFNLTNLVLMFVLPVAE